MVLSGDTVKVMPGSHSVVQVVKIVQKDQKDKNAEFESYVFWIFMHNSNDSKT